MPARGARVEARPLLRQMVAIYRARIGFLLAAALIIVVPTTLLDTATEHGDVTLESGDVLELASAGVALVFVFVALLGHEFYAGVVGSVAREAREGRPPQGLREVLAHLPLVALVIADILYTIGVGIGIVLLVVPGLVFGTWYALTPVVIKVERLGVRAAFGRSRELVRGHFRLVLVLVGGVAVATEGLTALVELGEEEIVGESFVADWLTAVVIDVATLPIYGVVVSILALELMDLKGPPAQTANAASS